MGASRSVARTLTVGLCPSSTRFLCNSKHVTVSYIKTENKLKTSIAQLCVLLVFACEEETDFLNCC